MTKEIDFYGSQLLLCWRYLMQMLQKNGRGGVFANIMLDLYANVHMIIEMLNATFPFAGSFVESQNTNFVRLLHVQTRAIYSSQLCR